MIFDRILEQDTILDRVDAYSIYSFYIGKELELGAAYVSPLRDDDVVPSFAMYIYKGQIFFKDHALGMSGTVFKFVKELFRYDTMKDAMSRINVDFELELLGGNPDITKLGNKPKLVNGYKIKDPLKAIKVRSKSQICKSFADFWFKYGIEQVILDLYGVTQIDTIQYIYTKSTLTLYPIILTIAYPIYDKYKIYTPDGEKAKKFLNNYPINYIEGYLQLKYANNFLVITKAMKEIMFFRQHFDWDTIAGKSENTMIKRHMMLKLLSKYKYIFILLDNDTAGIRAMKAYMEEYPFLIPVYYEGREKDPTDSYNVADDKEQVLTEIKNLIYERTNKRP